MNTWTPNTQSRHWRKIKGNSPAKGRQFKLSGNLKGFAKVWYSCKKTPAQQIPWQYLFPHQTAQSTKEDSSGNLCNICSDNINSNDAFVFLIISDACSQQPDLKDQCLVNYEDAQLLRFLFKLQSDLSTFAKPNAAIHRLNCLLWPQ